MRKIARRPPSRRLARRRRPSRTRRVASRSPLARRVLLAVVLLAVLVFPVASAATGGPPPSACRGCRPQAATAQRWAAPLSGRWTAGGMSGAAGTLPVTGQAYVAVGDGITVLGDGLTLTAFALSDGARLWQVTLAGPPGGGAIVSVRAWPGVITAGLLAAGGQQRTEAVIDAATGRAIHRYPAAVLGGAVAASLASTVIVGRAGVTSYDNASGRTRWFRVTGANRSWRADGQTLYVAESAGGYLASSPVTALKVINLRSGTERTLGSPLGHPFSGTLAMADGGAVLFASASGVTAYSGSTGDALWSMAAAVPEGADPVAGLVYLTSAGSTLTGVDPLTGAVRRSVSGSTAGGSAGIYVVRGGIALGLDSGANGTAWGYSAAAGRVTWTSPVLPWPHYFSDLSGLGGSADLASDVVVVTACPQLAAAAAAKICSDPELVAFTL